tara:strand:+ start:727 stop:1296 length:570 start_codon:yes stop_codon:yes gene_type:complete
MNKKIIAIIVTIFFISVFLFFSPKSSKDTKIIKKENNKEDNLSYSSSFIENVRYESQDTKGNKYLIKASLGEIDYQNPNEIFLTDVIGIIKLVDKSNIEIKSDFGKYNIDNNDTIFSKNVKIEKSNDKIYGDYLDFSIERNIMSLSKNVTYSNLSSMIKADVVEIDLATKKTKIFMYEDKKKVKIKNFN